jgi:hypothetical protein
LHGPGNIDIAELLVHMQFAIYSSPSDFDMTSKSGIAILNKASVGCEDDVHDVSSQETHDRTEWTDVRDQEETEQMVIFVKFLYLQLLVRFKFQDVQYYDKLHEHHSYRLTVESVVALCLLVCPFPLAFVSSFHIWLKC